MTRTRRGWTWAWAAATLATGGCGDGAVGPPDPPSQPQVARIELSAGEPDEHVVGDTAAVTARALSAAGVGIGGTTVRFSAGPASGHVYPESAVTGAAGVARASWVLDTIPGDQTLTATAGAVSQRLQATVKPGRPATLAADTTKLSGSPGSPTTQAPVAWVHDRFRNPVPDVPVSFSASEGSSANPAQALTGADGQATTVWTLGPDPGDYTLTAETAGVGGVEFLATAYDRLLGVLDDTMVVTSADTAFVLPVVAPPEQEWTVRVIDEARWLHDEPVLEVKRSADSRGVEMRVRSPSFARIVVETVEQSDELVVVVALPRPIVTAVHQANWPDSSDAVLRGYHLDRVPLPAIQVDGQPVLAYGDSAEIVIRPPFLGDGACSGPAAAPGRLSVVGATIAAEAVVMRAAGPLLSLATGESRRFDANDECLRMLTPPGARFAVASVDRTYIDQSREEPEALTYAGHPVYSIFVADSTPNAGWSPAPRQAQQLHLHDLLVDRPPDVRVHNLAAAAGIAANVYTHPDPYVVGDEFEWYTNNSSERTGTWQVMALYPPNVALAVFKDDLPALWNDARKAAMDSLFMELGSDAVQGMYKNIFGPDPPATSPATGQMLVMFHDGEDGEGTGVNIPSRIDHRYSTIHFRRVHFQDDNGWYRTLVSHEFAHAWQFRNLQAFSAVWSTEGIANFFAEEFVRVAAGLSLDANVDAERRVDGWSWRMPWSGSFASGYRESHPFLRFLVERLVLGHGRSYESAIRRVIRGAAEGWHGRHFVEWGAWENTRQGRGLVDYMQEVVPTWDPVEARLDWMLSIALDDRAPGAGYDFPFVHEAWQVFGPRTELRLGDGREASIRATRGGNGYYVLNGGSESASVRLSVVSGEAEVAWKIVRFR